MTARDDSRTADEILLDMVADGDEDDQLWARIAMRLGWPVPSVIARFEVLKRQLGWLGD